MAQPPTPLPFRSVRELQGVTDVSASLTIDREHLAGFAFSTYLTAGDLGRSLPDSPTHDLVDGFQSLSLVAHADLARPFLDPATTYESRSDRPRPVTSQPGTSGGTGTTPALAYAGDSSPSS